MGLKTRVIVIGLIVILVGIVSFPVLGVIAAIGVLGTNCVPASLVTPPASPTTTATPTPFPTPISSTTPSAVPTTTGTACARRDVSGTWQVPLNPGTYGIGDLFGLRFHPVYHIWEMHNGIDLEAKKGAPVYAASAGTVSYVGDYEDIGNYIAISHPGGIVTGYGHLKGYVTGLQVGDTVTAGELIGYVGSTGVSTGPHLYFRVIVDGKIVDPLGFMDSVGVSLRGEAKG